MDVKQHPKIRIWGQKAENESLRELNVWTKGGTDFHLREKKMKQDEES